MRLNENNNYSNWYLVLVCITLILSFANVMAEEEGPIVVDNINGFTNDDITIIAEALDEVSGGERIILPDGTEVEGDEAEYIVKENGVYTFEAYDKVGNKKVSSFEITQIDRVDPEIEAEFQNDDMTNQDVLVKITSTDDYSGPDKIALPDGTEVVGGEADYYAPLNGIYTFTAYDKAGNTASTQVEITNIDKTLPILTVDGDYNRDWTNEDITVCVVTDKGDIEKTCHTFTRNGVFIFRAIDYLGNIGELKVEITNIDKDKPIIKEKIEMLEANEKGFVERLVKINVIDEGSGVDKIILPDGTEIAGEEAEFVADDYGSYLVKAYDNLGHLAEKYISINKPRPSISIEEYNKEWTNKDITVKAKVSGGTLDVDSYTFTENGSFIFTAINSYGMTDSKEVIITNIDKIKPDISIKPDKYLGTLEDITINVKAEDKESGIEKIILPDGTEVEGDKTEFIVEENGTYIFTVYDIAANKLEKGINVPNIYDKDKLKEIEEMLNSISIIDKNTNLDAVTNIINDIQEEIDKLYDGDKKDELQKKLDKIKKLVQDEKSRRKKLLEEKNVGQKTEKGNIDKSDSNDIWDNNQNIENGNNGGFLEKPIIEKEDNKINNEEVNNDLDEKEEKPSNFKTFFASFILLLFLVIGLVVKIIRKEENK